MVSPLLASPKTLMVRLLNDLTLGARARDKACNCYILLDVCKWNLSNLWTEQNHDAGLNFNQWIAVLFIKVSKPIFVAYKWAFGEVQKALCVLLFWQAVDSWLLAVAGFAIVQLWKWWLGWWHWRADGNKLYFFLLRLIQKWGKSC